MVVGGGQGWLWEEEIVVVGGGRGWLWEEGENGFGRKARMVVGGGREWFW